MDPFDDSYSARLAPMDPVSIISTASASARLAKAGWEVGETLFNFAKDAKVVNQTLAALAKLNSVSTGGLERIPGEAVYKSRLQTKMTPLPFAVMLRDTKFSFLLMEAGLDEGGGYIRLDGRLRLVPCRCALTSLTCALWSGTRTWCRC